MDAVEAETHPGDNSTYKVVGVVRRSDLAVGVAGLAGPVQSGTSLSYTITITNNSPSNSSDMVLTSTYPNDNLAVGGIEGGTCDQAAGRITCRSDSLAATETVRVTIQACLLAISPSEVTLEVAVTGLDEEPDAATGSTTPV